ncbi:P-loop containing nucleoside triphosphate hydrolase protein [Suillus bovinus]|uniref:P-loop containing nucleoside triphosphate hydrolase protein n=1 Tax=Suillus bovinus TaxID=48563 RepID=UPI001B87815F|nr:P-loop containing nucleoside triphosphate hydrolase protein [Suillus bovinus]KAG2131409.1 P-loop containing nucleoside triphosphate hydrolase protein [Suillus bovinus]
MCHHSDFRQRCGGELKQRGQQSYHAVCRLIEQYFSKEAASKNRDRTIVLFGDTGAGQSSVVNLIAGNEVARTSPDMQRCTMGWTEYHIGFDGGSYTVFDTIGLQVPQLGIEEYIESVKGAYRLVKKLDENGGIDLLIYCVRAGRVTATLQSNYRLFHEFLCEKKVPIVLVITNLERERLGWRTGGIETKRPSASTRFRSPVMRASPLPINWTADTKFFMKNRESRSASLLRNLLPAGRSRNGQEDTACSFRLCSS